MSSRASGELAAQHRTGRRRSNGAVVWLSALVGAWTAFGVVALTSPPTLQDLWHWLQSLPLLAEIVLWIAALPLMLGLAVGAVGSTRKRSPGRSPWR